MKIDATRCEVTMGQPNYATMADWIMEMVKSMKDVVVTMKELIESNRAEEKT